MADQIRPTNLFSGVLGAPGSTTYAFTSDAVFIITNVSLWINSVVGSDQGLVEAYGGAIAFCQPPELPAGAASQLGFTARRCYIPIETGCNLTVTAFGATPVEYNISGFWWQASNY